MAGGQLGVDWPCKLTSVVAVIDRLSFFLKTSSRSVSALLVPPNPNGAVLLLHKLLETIEERQ